MNGDDGRDERSLSWLARSGVSTAWWRTAKDDLTGVGRFSAALAADYVR
jgi:hypothetical protein